MRPKTTIADLPTTHVVRVKISNDFIDFLTQLKEDIGAALGLVSVTWDLWTEDHTSNPHFGLTGQWIEVKGDSWKLRVEVFAFHVITGAHDGDNLGRWFVRFLDRAGVTLKTHNKVCACILSLSFY